MAVVYGEWTADTVAQWSYLDPSVSALGVQMTYKGSSRDCPYTTTVQFRCASAQGKIIVQEDPKNHQCGIIFVMTTPLACPAAVFKQEQEEEEEKEEAKQQVGVGIKKTLRSRAQRVALA
jgi:hypothetical protein